MFSFIFFGVGFFAGIKRCAGLLRIEIGRGYAQHEAKAWLINTAGLILPLLDVFHGLWFWHSNARLGERHAAYLDRFADKEFSGFFHVEI